jgi:hypothetical protein
MAEEITKRRVTMRNASTVSKSDGPVQIIESSQVDYVREDFLDAYVADARANWDSVEVSDEYDAGPGGYHGVTHVGAHLDHPLAGQTFKATTPAGGAASKIVSLLPQAVVTHVLLAGMLAVVALLLRPMAIQTAAMRNILETAYGTAAAYGAVYTTAPGGSAGTEPSGGSPAYARIALSWTGNAPRTASAVFNIPAGATLVGGGVHSAVTAGTYYDGGSVTSQPFASQGTYTLTYSYTQS